MSFQRIIYIYLAGCVLSGLILIKDALITEEEEWEKIRGELQIYPKNIRKLVISGTVILFILSSWYIVYEDIKEIIIDFREGN